MSKPIPIATIAEQAALSHLAFDKKVLPNLHWEADLFALETHRIIFEAMTRVHQRTGSCVGVATISELESAGMLELAGGREGVRQILKTITTAPGNFSLEQADDFRHQLIRARSYRKTLKLIEAADDDIRWMRADLSDLSEQIAQAGGERGDSTTTLNDHITELLDDLEGKTPLETFGTGLPSFDRHFRSGIRPGELIVVGAETSGGKSILLGQYVLEALKAGKAVAVFSLEMPSKSILQRLAAATIGKPIVPVSEIQTVHDKRNAATAADMTKAFSWLMQSKLTIRDDLHEVGEIIAEANRLAACGKADLVVVDYLQIVTMPKADTREQAISELARRLKLTSTKANIAVVTASQLNEDGKLRESRAIGHHSDFVVTILHEGNGSKIRILKNRRGPRDIEIPVRMRGEISRFEEDTK
jgi:replicative DNA helicase